MTNKTTTFILGWIFLISSFISNYDTSIICASIFFVAYFIIKEIQKITRYVDKNN